MSPDDAIALIVGIASASVTAELSKNARMLLDMPLRHGVRKHWSDLALSFAPHVLNLPTAHPFQDGFRALFREELSELPPGSEREDLGGLMVFNPLCDIDALRVTIGVNGFRTVDFAVIEARGTEEKTLKNFYSTRALRPGVEKDEDPGGPHLGHRCLWLAPR
jgi:hypothetical protein